MKGKMLCLFAVISACAAYGQTDSTMADTISSYAGTINTTDTLAARTAARPKDTDPVYRLKPGVDVPITVAAAGWSLYGFTQVYSKESATEAEVMALRKSEINGFDRWAADIYSDKAEKVSDVPFYLAMPLPLLLLADKDIRQDAGKIGFLYLESMAITGLLYTGSTYIWDRYRPLAYNPEAPMNYRTEGGARNSFFAGHVALVGTSTFFMAKVYSDYHPNSSFRHVLWGLAAVATGTTGYLRHRAGKHFPSDILVGTAVGTLTGILVPHFHKTGRKNRSESGLSITPFTGRTHGLSLVYKL